MVRTKQSLFAAGISLALAFTFSCSGDDGGDGNGGGCPISDISANSVTCGGQTYKTVEIGTQTWFAENLNYDAPGSKCNADDPANCATYGRLYNWETAMKACPDGWHLPSDEEWTTLTDFVGGSSEAGTKLKAESGWDENGNGTDEFEFSALPGGLRYSVDQFTPGGNGGFWWSTEEFDRNGAYGLYIYSSNEDASLAEYYKSNLLSVRCLRD